jgi:YVTN family beta-propeller protein
MSSRVTMTARRRLALVLLAAVAATAVLITRAESEPSNGSTATVTVGTFPTAIALSPDASTAYVVNEFNCTSQNGTVSVISTGANPPVVTKTITVGKCAEALVVSPDGRRVYVANGGPGTVSVIDTSTQTVTATVSLGSNSSPRAIGISPDGRYVYAAGYLGEAVSVIDTTLSTPAVVATVSLGAAGSATGMSVSPDGSRIYIDDSFAPSVGLQVLDASNPAAPTLLSSTVAASPTPYASAFKPGTSTLWTTDESAGTATPVDTSTSPPTIGSALPVGIQPEGLAFTSDGRYAYVAAGDLIVVDTTTSPASVVADVPTTGDGAEAVAITPDGWVYAANFSSKSVTVLPVASFPQISSISPSSGSAAGGTTVTINGTGLAGTSEVSFGTGSYGIYASIQSVSDTQVVVTSPPSLGVSPVPVTVFASNGQAMGQFTYSVGVGTSSLPDADVGQAYSSTLAAAGGTGPFTWSIASGALPTGLALNATTGAITGTPASIGTSSFTVQVADSESPVASATQALSINVNTVPSITTASLPGAVEGSFYSQQLGTQNGAGPFLWSIGSGSLPTGLSLDPATGTISGFLSGTTGSSFTVTLTDAFGLTASANLSIDVFAITTSLTLPRGAVGVPYSTTFAAIGNTGTITWSKSGSLPTGLTLSSSGVLSGTPTATSTKNVTIFASDSVASASASFSITVSATLAVSTASLAAAANGSAYSATFAATGGTSPYTWSIATGSLPAGLNLNASTGAITGTATTNGISSFTVQATDSTTPTHATATKALSIAVEPALAITTTSVPNFVRSTAYSAAIAATGGVGAYTWSVSSGTLPSGLSLNATTGIVGGTAGSTAATATVTIRVVDPAGLAATRSLAFTRGTVLTITSNNLPSGAVGTAYSGTVTAGAGTTPYTWSITTGSLPSGLSQNTSTGAITGTPTTGGTFPFTVKVTDSSTGHTTATAAFSITVAGPVTLVVSTTSLATGQNGISYSATLAASGGLTPYAWSIAGGALPAGLSLDSSTGAITGTPTVDGTSTFTVQVADSTTPAAATATKSFSMAIVEPLAITTASLPDGALSTAYSAALVATGGTAPYTWALTSGTLPTGLNLNTSTGAITGTPSLAVANRSLTFAATDSSVPSLSTPATLTITTIAPLVVSTTALSEAQNGVAYAATVAAIGGHAPYSWSIASGSLPDGLSLDPTGAITGTPTADGTSSFTVQVGDGASTATANLSILVADPLVISTTSLPGADRSSTYSTTLHATGGTGPYTWAESGTLPSGFSFNTTTGVLSGTTTTMTQRSLTFTITDSLGLSVHTAALTLSIATAPSISTSSVPDGAVGSAYSTTLTTSGGTAPFTWAVSAGSLPFGLTLDAATGIIWGTPLSASVSSFTVRATDSAGTPVSKTKNLTLTIVGPPAVTGISPSSGPTVGGTTVTIAGSGFTNATGVSFGSVSVDPSGFYVASDSEIDVSAPAQGGATVDVTVTTGGGTSPPSSADRFTYVEQTLVGGSWPLLIAGYNQVARIDSGGTFLNDGWGYVYPLVYSPDGTRAVLGTAAPVEVVADPNTSHSSVIATFSLPDGQWPDDIAITPDGTRAYVTYGDPNSGVFSLMVISGLDTATPTVSQNISLPAGSNPYSIAITPDGQTAYIGYEGMGQLGVVTGVTTGTPTISSTISLPVPSAPEALAITPDGSTLYVADAGVDGDHIQTVVGVETATPSMGASLPLSSGAFPVTVAITPDGKYAYVGEYSNNDLVVVRNASSASPTLSSTPLPIGAVPIGLAISPDGNTLYAGKLNTGNVALISGADTDSPTVSSSLLNGGPAGSTLIAVTPDQAPVADLTVTPGAAGDETTLDASTSTVEYGTIASYRWNFGDGDTATTTTPTTTHVYTDAGAYGASVTETSSAGTSMAQVYTGHTAILNGGTTAHAADDFDVGTATSFTVQIDGGSAATIGSGSQATLSAIGLPADATGTITFTVGATTLCTATLPAVDCQTSLALAVGNYGAITAHFTNTDGTYADSDSDNTVTIDVAPVVSGLSPTSGPESGGTTVAISGSGFTAASAVSFGSTPATGFTVTSDGVVTATAPAGTSTVDVTVTAAGEQSAAVVADRFTYVPRPAISGLSPTAAPESGGTSVTITGTDLTGTTAVTFGTTAATGFSVTSATSVTATAPAGTGTVDIQVTTAGGTTATSAADQFTYVPAPTSAGVAPSAGPESGGTPVTITGTDLTGATAVTFGATAATAFTVNSATSITATAPAGTGTVDVRVTTVGGTSTTSADDQFTYVPAPTVSSVSPASGPTGGGTAVTITGTNLTGATAVTFGATAAGSVTVNGPMSITATAPAGTGTVDMRVTTIGGTSATSSADEFTYVPAPAVTSMSPTAGPVSGGTSVTITGTDLTGATAVTFGATAAASFTVDSATTVTASSPAGTGTVDVLVTTAGGTSATSAADQFTYVVAPTVTAVSPGTGPTGGGTSVTITGTDFVGATAVTFGATAATSFTVDSSTSVTATAPAGSGTVDVGVTTVGGTSSASSADQFAYVSAPAVTGISPSAGPTAGGTSVTITGTDFDGATAVTFDAAAAASFTVNSATSITATSPAGSGTAHIHVTTVGGTSAASSADEFSYASGPAVGAVSPSAGPTAGGTLVTITGTDLAGATAVSFGSTAAASFTVDSPTSITATSPAGSGTVDVQVTTAGGTTATSSADRFTYADGPAVTGLSPATGLTAGGTSVAISGANLTGATAVAFGSTPAASFVVSSATSIVAVSPAGSGTVDVTVTTPGGASATSAADLYRFADPAPPAPPAPTTTQTSTVSTFTTTTPQPVSSAPVSPTVANTVAVGAGTPSAVTVSVPAGAVSVAATVTATLVTSLPTVTTASTGTTTPAVTFAAGGTPVRVTVTSDTGAPITRFTAPLDLQFASPVDGVTPAYSENGVDWIEIPEVPSPPTLPDGWPDGWYTDGSGTLHVLTRHATYFGLLDSTSTFAPALDVAFGVRRHVNLNYRHGLMLYLLPTLPSTCTVTLRRGDEVVQTWTASRSTSSPSGWWLALPPGKRRTGSYTLDVVVDAGSEKPVTEHVALDVFARWLNPALNRS